jgi:hypothetical protein
MTESSLVQPEADCVPYKDHPAPGRPLLRTASFDDYAQIAAVEQANGLSAKPREEWLHLWQDNPAYQQLPGWPIGWVLEDDDGRIVGSLENIPCLYRFGGKIYVAAFGRGWAVDVRYRAFSLQLLARQSQQSGVALRLTTTAGPGTTALLTRWGWSRVPAGQWDRSAFWVTSYAGAVSHYLAAKTSRRISALASAVLDPPLRLADFLYGRAREAGTRFELRWCADFDDRFDRFWEELEARNSNVLLSLRDPQTLRWHFKYLLEQGRIWILTACDGPRLLAYAIFERRDVASLDLTRMLLIDFEKIVKDPLLAPAMISYALERCRQERFHLLENVGCWLEEKQTPIQGAFHRRDLGNWCYLYHTSDPDLADALRQAKSWYPTQYDADASL